MNIFENLENLNVSEECFNDIISRAESILEGLFIKDGRGDLIADIYKAVGSPGKKEMREIVKRFLSKDVKNAEGKVKNAKGKVKNK